jgi:hypothetical protein
MPGDIDPDKDPQQALARMTSAEKTKEYVAWPKLPLDGNVVEDLIIISSANSNTAWVGLQKEVNVLAKVLTPGPPDVPALRTISGGGGGTIRKFPAVALEPKLDPYSRKVTPAGTEDYFTLQPGEFETFHFDFLCTYPGLYNVTLEISYTYGADSGKYSDPAVEILCPQKYSVWSNLGTRLDFAGAYTWTGTTYIKEP